MTESDKILIEDYMYRIQQGTEIINHAIQDMNDFVLQDMEVDTKIGIKENIDMDIIQQHLNAIQNSTEVIQRELFKGLK